MVKLGRTARAASDAEEAGGGVWDVMKKVGSAVVSDLAKGQNNSVLRQGASQLSSMLPQDSALGRIAGAANSASNLAAQYGFGKLPRAKPRWSERTKAKHAFMKSLSKAGVPLSKLARAAAAALSVQEHGAGIDVAMEAGMKAVGM